MIVFDLEWNHGYDKTPLEEILQIGAVKLDRLGGRIADTFSIFVHPCVHKRLNRTAKTLPELNAAFDSPYDFPTALSIFKEWCGEDTVFADWGGDDFDVLRQNCDFWIVPPPEATEHIDLQMAFSLRVGTNQGVALHRAVEYCGIPTPFTFHNALNDALYTAVLSEWIDDDTMALLSLPKEIRRLGNVPAFPPQEVRQAGPYGSLRSALNGRGCRRLACPVCGKPAWVRRWYTNQPNVYYGDFRCKEHGSFVSRLTVVQSPEGLWQGQVEVPAVTPVLLSAFDAAIHGQSVICKAGGQHKKRHIRSRTPKKAEK